MVTFFLPVEPSFGVWGPVSTNRRPVSPLTRAGRANKSPLRVRMFVGLLYFSSGFLRDFYHNLNAPRLVSPSQKGYT